MKIKLSHILLLSAVVLCGCRKEPMEVPGPGNGVEDEGLMITLAAGVDNLDTRTLIEKDTNGADDGFVSIQEACNEDGNIKNSIGFWTDMIYRDEDGNEQHRYDVFNSTGEQTKLIYRESYAADNNGAWTYAGSKQYWSIGASYNFVAYYPQTMSKYILDASSEASVNTFVLSYNTHQEQEDLMVAYNSVHTDDPITRKPSIYRSKNQSVAEDLEWAEKDGKNISGFKTPFQLAAETDADGNVTKPKDNVPLHFMHTLAAVRFQFKFNYPDSDELLECWLQNDGSEKGLHTVGTLVFGVGSREAEKETDAYKEKDAEEKADFEHHEKDDFSWTSYLTIDEHFKMYHWGVQESSYVAEGGVPFSYTDENNSVTATAYIDNNGTKALSLIADADTYVEHDGWIMFIPQESPGNVTFNYRLLSSNREHTSVSIPAFTGTNAAGEKFDEKTYKVGEVSYDPENEEHVKARDAEFNQYLPGNLYTYTILIDKTQFYLNLSMESWEEIHSSKEIIF